MTRRPILSVLLILAATLCLTAGPASAHTLRLADRSFIGLDELMEELASVRLVFMGELHDSDAHHRAQLQVIRELRERGVPVAIGLEMFRRDSQSALDRWISGELDEEQFLPLYRDNWGMWDHYREIFRYARDAEVPMIGLNVSREITGQVARGGFDSLEPEQLEKIPGITCVVDPVYEEFIRRSLGGHHNNGAAFENFCEAQLLWDKVMARNLVEYLDTHPERVIVVLAGSGHSWKHGIPAQLDNIPPAQYRVLLPEIPGYRDASTLTERDADFLLMGLEEGPIH